MARNFLGKEDKSAVILSNVFPRSNLVVSTPIDYLGQRSSVYIEGDDKHVEVIFACLQKLTGAEFDDDTFGRWIGVTPPEYDLSRTAIHYEAQREINKIQLLSCVLPRHLAKICNLAIANIANLVVRFDGKIIQKSFIILPEDLTMGDLILSLLEENKKIILS